MFARWFSALALAALLSTPVIAAVGDCNELTGLQVAAGFVTWLNVVKFFVIVGLVFSITVFCRHWVVALLLLFTALPVQVYEGLGYLIAFGLVASGAWIEGPDQIYPVVGGSLFFGALWMLSARLHSRGENYAVFFGVLFLVWATIARLFNNDLMGLFAVLALMGTLGFSAMLIPMGYAVGFQRGRLGSGTIAALLVTVASTLWYLRSAPGDGMHYLKTNVPAFDNPFEMGALWVGPLVFFLGLLIMASRYYHPRSRSYGDYDRVVPSSYVARQIPAFVFGFLAMFVGSVYGVPHLAGIGGTFFVLYIIEKASDIPASSLVDYAFVVLITCGVLGALVWIAQHNVEFFKPYLLF